MVRGVNPLSRFLGSAALAWILAWLPVGLWVGDLDFVLTPVSRGTWERQLYQVLLYSGLFFLFVDSWRRFKPKRPRWGSWRLFALFFVQGLLATFVLRGVLYQAGWATWSWVAPSALEMARIGLSCVVVALVEEAVFRGFLLGHLVEKWGWRKGAWTSCALFASVHLFRPGSPSFKLCYGLGLVLLAYLLSCLAWHYESILCSAGFHGGVILLNLATTMESFEPTIWSGWNSEPVSGLVSGLLTLAFLGAWSYLVKWSPRSRDSSAET